MDLRITRLLKAYTNADPPPTRVKPLPIQILHRVTATVSHTTNPTLQAAIDCAWLAFFFLLRPGEYCAGTSPSPIRLCDVAFSVGDVHVNPCHSPIALIEQATHSSITFVEQKNGVKGEIIGHGRSGHSVACPTRTLARRVIYLRHHSASPTTPLATVYLPHPTLVTSTLITALLRDAIPLCAPLGLTPADITARSLRAGGAMSLLCGRVDSDTIRLVGRWRSDAMFRYLHAQTLPILNGLANTMVQHGQFALLPGQDIPAAAADILNPQPR
jgi:hypothetical protein